MALIKTYSKEIRKQSDIISSVKTYSQKGSSTIIFFMFILMFMHINIRGSYAQSSKLMSGSERNNNETYNGEWKNKLQKDEDITTSHLKITQKGVGVIKFGMRTSSIPNRIEGLYNKKTLEEDIYGDPLIVLYNNENKVFEIGIEDGKVSVITVYSSDGIATINGIHVGTSVRDLIDKYGFIVSYVDYGECELSPGLYTEAPQKDHLHYVSLSGNITKAAMKRIEKLRDQNGHVSAQVYSSEILNGEVESITVISSQDITVEQVKETVNSVSSFNSYQDFANYFSSTRKYKGRGPFFDGVIELKCGVNEISVYVNGYYLSPLGLEKQNQKYLFGDYARMAVYVEGRTYPLVVHLPDDKHPYDYIYFEPIKTSTNRNIASALNLPITDGWLWVEPNVQNKKATIIWHTDEVSKPSPIIYKLIDSDKD